MFKPGDKVKCVVPTRGQEHPLSTTITYTVHHLDPYDKYSIIYLKDVKRPYDEILAPVYANRFVLIESKPKRNLPDWW